MKLVNFGNGNITFVRAAKTQPATSETTGNVTVHKEEKLGYPAHFVVKYTINADLEVDGIQANQMFFAECIVPAVEAASPYSDIEDAAAHQIAPTLRQLADLIEQAVAETDKAKSD